MLLKYRIKNLPVSGFKLNICLLLLINPLFSQAQFDYWDTFDDKNVISSNVHNVSGTGDSVVGWFSCVTDSGSSPSLGYLWTEQNGIEALRMAPGSEADCEAFDILPDGSVIVGQGRIPSAFIPVKWITFSQAQEIAQSGACDGGIAKAISANGQVIVGGCTIPTRWVGGNQFGLGSLPGNQTLGGTPTVNNEGVANAVSADGSVIVGNIRNATNNIEAFRWTESTGMLGMGFLAGNSSQSSAEAVSADGKTIVGYSSSAEGVRAFIWTEESDSMAIIGSDNPSITYSQATDISADGNIVMGLYQYADSANRIQQTTFVWTQAAGIQDLKSLLSENGVHDADNWALTYPAAISADGTTIVGTGKHPDGRYIGFRAIVPVSLLSVSEPKAGDILFPGQMDTVRWQASANTQLVNIRLSTDNQASWVHINQQPVAADQGYFAWRVPETIFSNECIIEVYNADIDHQDQNGHSKIFSIKDYTLSRWDNNGKLEAFVPDKNGWQFSNNQDNMFPDLWAGLFEYYRDDDPFTNAPYPRYFSLPPVWAVTGQFPDWPSFVRRFSTATAYHFLIEGSYGIYKEGVVERWSTMRSRDTWHGSCSGFAISSLLGFAHRQQFAAAFPEIPAVEALYTLGANHLLINNAHNDIRELINQLYLHWWGLAAHNYYEQVKNKTPRQTLQDLKDILADTSNTSLGYVYFKNVGDKGAHAVAPYHLERDSGNPNAVWWLYIYDPNKPGDNNKFIVIDSTDNSWFYPDIDTSGWGGNTGFCVMNDVRAYLPTDTYRDLIFTSLKDAPGGKQVQATPLEIAVSAGATTSIKAGAGGEIGFADNTVFNSIDGAYANNPPTGYATPPVGYFLPADQYDIEVSDVPDSSAGVAIFDGNKIYSYFCNTRGAATTEKLDYSDGMSVMNTDDNSKTVHLKTITTLEDEERVFVFHDLDIASSASVKMVLKQNANASLEAKDGATSYSLQIRKNNADTSQAFSHDNIALDAGARHEFVPDWQSKDWQNIKIRIDADSDGIPDDSIFVKNEFKITNGFDPSRVSPLPQKFALQQNYPNPFNPLTIIRYSIANNSKVSLKIFDIAGKEIATLTDAWQPAGNYSVTFDAKNLGSGTYIYRLQAGEFVQEKKMILLK